MNALSQSIITAVQAQEPGWELEHTLVREDELTQRWKHGYERLVIRITRAATVEEAGTTLNEMPNRLSGSAEPQRRTDIGDDALVYSRFGPTGAAVVYFAKRAMFVHVSGPSENIAVRFAQLVAVEIL